MQMWAVAGNAAPCASKEAIVHGIISDRRREQSQICVRELVAHQEGVLCKYCLNALQPSFQVRLSPVIACLLGCKSRPART